MLDDAVECRRLTLHHRHIDGRDFHQGPSIDCQVEPSSVTPSDWRTIGEQDATLVPASVRVTDGSEVDRCPAEAMHLIHQIHAAHVRIRGGENPVVPGEDVLVLEERISGLIK